MPCSSWSASSTRSSPVCSPSRARWAAGVPSLLLWSSVTTGDVQQQYSRILLGPVIGLAESHRQSGTIPIKRGKVCRSEATLNMLRVACEGEEPMAECGCAQRSPAAVLWHQGGKLLHCALWSLARHWCPLTGVDTISYHSPCRSLAVKHPTTAYCSCQPW